MSKRGFDSTRELKVTLGSQLLQYLAKVALSSELTELVDLKDRLKHHERSKSVGKLCAGCKVPEKSVIIIEKCPVCHRATKCNRPSCEGVLNIHDCAVCGEQNLCDGNKDFDFTCVRCNKSVCENCQVKCEDCPLFCIKCQPLPAEQLVRQWLSKEAQTKWETERETEVVCVDCQVRVTHDEAIMTLCQQCNDEFNLLTCNYCKYFDCYVWVCPHDETNEGYCPEHKGEVTIKKPKI